MEFKRQKVSSNPKSTVRFGVNFYLNPPSENVSLEEFESLAIERLKALRIVEFVAMKHNKNTTKFCEALRTELARQKSQIQLYTKQLSDEKEQTRVDNISHFILQLAYCRSEELRRWFLQQECDLFRARLMENASDIPHILQNLGLNYEKVNLSEDEDLSKEVDAASFNTSVEKIDVVYKVPFVEVLELVQACDVYLEDGYAYTTGQQFISVLVNMFRISLSKSLAATARQLPVLEEDKRLLSILGSINEAYFGKDYNRNSSAKAGEVIPEMLDDLAKSSFPLCMKTLHESIRANHHLRHGGRLQYGFFLKAIGLKLEDALRFWREEFSKKMDVDQFDKKYSYNIRHSFGQEGIRKNYTAFSCMKIITSSPPATGECHGCPYKHMDKSSLLVKLRSMNLSQKGIQDIVDLASAGHYQVACTRSFEYANKVESLNQAFNHPNEYFEESKKVLNGEENADKRKKS